MTDSSKWFTSSRWAWFTSLSGHCEVLIYIRCERNAVVAVMYRNNIFEPRSHRDLNYSQDRWFRWDDRYVKSCVGVIFWPRLAARSKIAFEKCPAPSTVINWTRLSANRFHLLKCPRVSSTSKEAIHPSICFFSEFVKNGGKTVLPLSWQGQLGQRFRKNVVSWTPIDVKYLLEVPSEN